MLYFLENFVSRQGINVDKLLFAVKKKKKRINVEYMLKIKGIETSQ